MKNFSFIAFLTILLTCLPHTKGQVVFRFEHIGTEQGLSQNTGSSMLFDSKGFMWIGTMNGLNRYDGYEFRIYKGQSDKSSIFTNNRVTNIWEDRKGFIWVETYDGYYHYFNPRRETFSTVPDYQASIAANTHINTFLQYSEDIVILGSSNSGIFILRYDAADDHYQVSHYLDKGNHTLSNNQVRFVFADRNRDVWIGTSRGVNFLAGSDIAIQRIAFQHQFVNITFTAACESGNAIWFGTAENGIYAYDVNQKKFNFVNTGSYRPPASQIVSLFHLSNGLNLVGFAGGKVVATDTLGTAWHDIPFHGRSLSDVYEDRFGQAWLTALEFGVTRVDLATLQAKYYVLTPEAIKHLTDLERPQFYEDRHNNLWIGLHGGGLALYQRDDDRFGFFRNDPRNPNSISSNIVHSIAEDKTGQLWLGTGQFLGGLEKVILENPAFEHYLMEDDQSDLLDNVVRSIMEDRTRHLWVATKAGMIHVYDSAMRKIVSFDSLPGVGKESVRNNTYALFNDLDGYIWIGTKGDGLSVSTFPVDKKTDYGKLRFRRYRHLRKDTLSLGNNNIYSICQDHAKNIWIGTYGNGISLIRNPQEKPHRFIRINQQNSNLSSNLVRHLMVDKEGNLWVATVLGLNLLEKKDIDNGRFRFSKFFHDPSNKNSLSYNDVIHLFEDTKGSIWLGTFGGGADKLQKQQNGYSFTHYTSENGLSNDVVFGILEDEFGHMWFSSENGLIRLNPENGNVSIHNNFNGLYFSNFSENTCFGRKDETLCFGGYMGIELVFPARLVPERIQPHIELTNFLLFNKEVPVNAQGSPLNKNISFTDNITLRYNQSSFSLNFSALDFFDPAKINYAYKLDGFEEEWNYVGNQPKATYTNLSPGRYVFRVKSVRSSAALGSPERLLHIRIRPPWWRTLPAYLSYLLVASLIAVSIYKTVTRLNRYRRELLVEKKVNELKLQFFTNISHEIRTPLTLIIGPIEDIMATQGISPRNRTLMGIIHKNAKRMLHLTSQLLDFRKIQNNKMVLKISEFDLVAFTREIYESFIPLARHKGIQYCFDTDIENITLYGDRSKIDTIVYNIISNAIKFTHPGKRVNVAIKCTDTSPYVDICVSDEGPGIPQKNLSDIFTRYTILSNRDLAGTGIGLSLAYELAKIHQGDILISSVEGEGSTFTIRLLKGKDHLEESQLVIPATAETVGTQTRDQQETADEMVNDDPVENAVLQGRKDLLLIVEDNTEILNYITQAMHSDFTCIGAKNGEEGLHIAAQMNPDLVITDIMMPGMDGMEMTRKLKENFDTCHIPVVMLTSKVGMNDQIEGIETGAEAYILKPFNLNYLKAVTRNLLSQRQKIMARYTRQPDVQVDGVKVASRDENFLKKAIAFIEENYQQNFSIDEVAEHCCVGRTVFYNKIKGLTGLGPLEFVRKIKLKIAAQLLEKGYNVTEVAYKTGFSDVKYFSKQFKAMYGFSPSKQKNNTANT